MFGPGQTIRIGTGADLETAVIAGVGTAVATTVASAAPAGATLLHVGNTIGFHDGRTITIGSGADAQRALVAFITPSDNTITVAVPLTHAQPAGAAVSGTGITLTALLGREHLKAERRSPAASPRRVRPTRISGRGAEAAPDGIRTKDVPSLTAEVAGVLHVPVASVLGMLGISTERAASARKCGSGGGD